NLLTNAIKFTPPGGEVRVRVERGDHVGRVIVEDTGIGMDAAQIPQLFGMFQQGEIAGRRARGLGIGLALVKHLTELHGGRVWAESEGVGKGSRFTVELPLAPAATERPAEKETREPMGVRILLVEDNADARELLQDGLELLGYAVESAGSGEEALALLSRMRPDIIVADIGLPGVDGYEFLRQARRIPGLANVPAFAATGYGRPEDVARAHEAGFTDHFVKPVDIGDLDERIRGYLEMKQRE
ncbi:MAG TPA: response regulator, partial [Armatimonadetes bacterium]|nr:response regulator [Armatimonadota bacterium]